VDHVGAGPEGQINHPSNLQALCRTCHQTKTEAGFRRVSREESPEEWQHLQEIVEALERRVGAPEPQRLCDDERAWRTSWRGLARARQAIADSDDFDPLDDVDDFDLIQENGPGDPGNFGAYFRELMQRDD
jgi:hypothetical protein